MFRLIGAAALALTIGHAASASTVTYTDVASFRLENDNATVTERFNGNAITSADIQQILGAFNLANNRLQRVAGGANGNQSTTIVFTSAITSFGATVRSLGAGELANVLLDGIQVATLGPGSNFFGLKSTTAFTSITFVDATLPTRNTQFNLDNIRVAAVPLPAAFGMLALGIGALGAAKRRKRHSA
jgi:hypothetical protein